MLDSETPSVQDQIGDSNVITAPVADDSHQLFTLGNGDETYFVDDAWAQEMQKRDEEFDRLAALADAETAAMANILDGMIRSNRELSELMA